LHPPSGPLLPVRSSPIRSHTIQFQSGPLSFPLPLPAAAARTCQHASQIVSSDLLEFVLGSRGSRRSHVTPPGESPGSQWWDRGFRFSGSLDRMANQLILSWSVSVAGTSRTPAQAAAQLGAAALYQNADTDPVLGQFFGLTVDSDVTSATGTGATRTLTLNATSAVGSPTAPPPFPAHPNLSTPPVLPYPLTVAEELNGSFLVTSGSTTVETTLSQLAALDDTDVVQFNVQPGVNYPIAGVAAGFITLGTPFTGPTDNSDAVQIVSAPVTLAAVYSSSPLDSTTGSGARTVSISYTDSLGASGTVTVDLDGTYPVQLTLAGGTIDIATVTGMHVASVGGFGNSVGQITLSALAIDENTGLPVPILPEDTLDEAQMKLDLALVYLPPSYFALSQPQTSAPQLLGDFFVTTGSPNVPTSRNHTATLAAGNTIQFMSQIENDTPFGAEPVTYVIKHVGPKLIILETAYGGFDFQHRPVRPDQGTKSTRGDEVINLATAAMLISPSPAAPPSNAQLGTLLAQFVNPGIAVPPPNPPLIPATMLPTPTLLSGFFTQTLQLALAGVPVVPAAIAFA
jgi:hypothetical protein